MESAIDNILDRILADQISKEWLRYIIFAMYVVPIASGVRVWDPEKHMSPGYGMDLGSPLALNAEPIVVVFRTRMGAPGLFASVFFVFALIGFVIMRVANVRPEQRANE